MEDGGGDDGEGEAKGTGIESEMEQRCEEGIGALDIQAVNGFIGQIGNRHSEILQLEYAAGRTTQQVRCR